MAKKPNVLFILTDDQSYNTIHALGNPQIQTPNLDKLVQRGTSFTRAHIPGGTVSAVCMPSRGMINSGKTLFHLEENGRVIPADHVTMGENFLQNGYHCFETGKWHNGVDAFRRSFDAGENIFFGGMWDHWNVPVYDYQENGVYDHTIRFTPNFSASSETMSVIAQRIHAGVHSTELFTDSAVKYIENYDSDQPFFMYVSFLAPHDPRTMPEKYRTMYDPNEIQLPPNFQTMPDFSFGWAAKGRDENVEAYPRSEKAVRQHIADYYAMISHVDEHVGRMVTALENKGLLEDTIIVFCGDNGLAVGQHGLMGKQNVYEHSVGIPLIMAGPGIPENERRSQYVYLLDVYPTLCDLAGIDIPQSVDGRSFAKMFTDSSYITREDLYLAFQARIRGVMDQRYKLIEYRTDKVKLTQLFDLEKDPWETMNFYDMTGYEEITQRLRQRLQEYRQEWDDEGVLVGQQFWQQWQQYEDAALHGVGEPKGQNMAAQTREWGRPAQ